VASRLQVINFLGVACGIFMELHFKFTTDKMWEFEKDIYKCGTKISYYVSSLFLLR
jgi:hypothetical protein